MKLTWPKLTIHHRHQHVHSHNLSEATMSALSDLVREATKAITDLRAENGTLKAQVATLTADNAHLTAQLADDAVPADDVAALTAAVTPPTPSPAPAS